jgi:hypothetical protein
VDPFPVSRSSISLHAGDFEGGLAAAACRRPRGLSTHPALLQAWIAFHAGEFERAARLGLDVGVNGYAVAHKAICMHTNYRERQEAPGHLRMRGRALRAQQLEQPGQPGRLLARVCAGPVFAGHLGGEGAGAGLGAKVKRSLDMAIKLEPQRADAHIALGVYHAEILDKVGAVLAGLTYGVKKEEATASLNRPCS